VDVHEDQLDKILTKWLTHTAEREELDVLENWASQREENAQMMEIFQKIWDEKTSEPILVNVGERVSAIWEEGLTNKQRRSLSWTPMIKNAAVLFIFIGASFGIYHFVQKENVRQEGSTALSPSYIFKENRADQKTKIFLLDSLVAYLNSSSS